MSLQCPSLPPSLPSILQLQYAPLLHPSVEQSICLVPSPPGLLVCAGWSLVAERTVFWQMEVTVTMGLLPTQTHTACASLPDPIMVANEFCSLGSLSPLSVWARNRPVISSRACQPRAIGISQLSVTMAVMLNYIWFQSAHTASACGNWLRTWRMGGSSSQIKCFGHTLYLKPFC